MEQPDSLPSVIHASKTSSRLFTAEKKLRKSAPRVHCLTNAVTMNDVANILLAIGASAIMAQCEAEAAQITALCHATLLNTGTPSDEKFLACCLAGARANELKHPVVLDPVGVGASTYRQENIRKLLFKVHPTLIRCNLEEALTLLALAREPSGADETSGAESGHPLPTHTPGPSGADETSGAESDHPLPTHTPRPSGADETSGAESGRLLPAHTPEPAKADETSGSENDRLLPAHTPGLAGADGTSGAESDHLLPTHTPRPAGADGTSGAESGHLLPPHTPGPSGADEIGMKTAVCTIRHGGVESGMDADIRTRADTAAQLASTYHTAVLLSGGTDVVSDGEHTTLIAGGDSRITRITGGGCMLSAIAAAFLAAGEKGYDAALDASIRWKQAAEYAGQKTDAHAAGMGSFHTFLFDAATNPGYAKL